MTSSTDLRRTGRPHEERRRTHRRPPEHASAARTPRFDDFGLDSLGLLGIVGELENRYGSPLPADAERCKTPRRVPRPRQHTPSHGRSLTMTGHTENEIIIAAPSTWSGT